MPSKKSNTSRSGSKSGSKAGSQFGSQTEFKTRSKDGQACQERRARILLYGKHACAAALTNEHRVIDRIWVTRQGLEGIKPLDMDQMSQLPGPHKRPSYELVDKKTLDRLFPQPVVHQGIVVRAHPLETCSPEDLCAPIKKADKIKSHEVVLILDQVTDPQNVGGILRLCRAFDVKGLIMSKHHAPLESGAMAKVASGALEFIPRCIVPNLAEAIRQLKKEGFWTIGLMEGADQSLRQIQLPKKIAIIMGSEGDGLRSLTSKLCDFRAFLPTSSFSTLNVTTATAITLYEIFCSFLDKT